MTVDVAHLVDDARWTRYQKLVVSLTALSIVIDGVDSQLLGIAAPAIMREWQVDRAALAPVLALGFVGMMVGGAAAGVAGDRWGRRVALIGSVFLFGVMTLGASLAAGLVALGALRFGVGIGLQGASPNAAALVSELSPRRMRTVAVTATIVCVPAGAMVAGLIAIPLLPALGWRALFGVGGLLALVIGAVLLVWLPESPRFLVRHPSRWRELTRLAQRLGAAGQEPATFVDSSEAVSERTPLRAILEPSYRSDTIALWSAFFFCLLAVYSGFNWVPSMLTGAGLDATVATTGITAYNLGGVIGAIGGAMAINRYGSRRTMLALAAAAAVVAAAMSTMTLSPGSAVAPIVASLAVIGALINGVQVTMYALATYVYASSVRATGVGTATSVGRLGAILSTYAGAWALGFGGGGAFFVLVAAAMAAVAMSLAVVRRHIPASTPGGSRRAASYVGAAVFLVAAGLASNAGAARVDDDLSALVAAAEHGNAGAQFDLGVRYATGRGVAEDDAEAARWIRRAAEQGHVDAQFNLGLMYADGNGVTQDSTEAVRWLQKAADQGDARAESNLALMYANGSGVPMDPAMAVQWYRKAADGGERTAQFTLGLYYANGTGVPRDPVAAATWFRKAADQGHLLAQYNLGLSYAMGNGVAHDSAQAIVWFRRAAEQGDAQSQFMLGLVYANGSGVPQNDGEAVRWYRAAAEQGLASAQTNLGARYIDGRGVAPDPEQAMAWFRRAASQGDAEAAFNLGVMFANGVGVQQDPVQAYRWLTIAVARSTSDVRQKYSAALETVRRGLTAQQLTTAESAGH